MAKIIEYLAVQHAARFFIVNTAAVSVACNNAPFGVFANNIGNHIFSRGDSLVLLSYGIMLPENFTFFGETVFPSMSINGTSGGDIFPLPCFQNSAISELLIIEENTELEINGFCDYNSFRAFTTNNLITGNFHLYPVFAVAPSISMLNVPAAANGRTYRYTPFIKVAHNIPLT